jgi:folate-binding Fe-S cluster repair protein YgfZ
MSKTEYDLATNSAGLIDLSSRSKIEMTGADRVKFLQNLCTNDVGKLGPGQGCEAFLLDAKGRIVDYVNILAAEDSVWLDAAPGRTEPLMQHLDRYIIRSESRRGVGSESMRRRGVDEAA